jgi:hypothetical protein
MADDKKQNEETVNKKESDDYYFELWKYYENVAMHFNDLIIKLRIQSIGGLAALATIMGIVLHNTKDNNNDSFNYSLATIALVPHNI